MITKLNTKIQVNDFDFWKHHYFGWPAIMKFLQENSYVIGDNYTLLEPSIEDTFVHLREQKTRQLKNYNERPWVGFAHHNANDPRIRSRLDTIIKDERNKQAFENCKGIFVLTKQQKESFAKLPEFEGIPISALYHPMEKYNSDSVYKLESLYYKTQLNPLPINTFCMVGDHCRDWSNFARCKLNMQKTVILEDDNHWRGPAAKTRRDEELAHDCVKYNLRFSNEDYDKILCNNVQFCDLQHPSAINYLLECIVRGTPILISRNESVVEYLGEDYPLYIGTSHKRWKWDSNPQSWTSCCRPPRKLLKETSEYLLNHPFKEKFTLDYFLKSFIESEVYETL